MTIKETTVCDFCNKEISGKLPFHWHIIEATVKNRDSIRAFDAAMCETCYDQTVEQTLRGLLRRMFDRIKRKKNV